jgi:hypothetical protein
MATTAELNFLGQRAGPPDTILEEDHPMTILSVWFQLSNWFQTRRFLCFFSIGSYVKLSSAVGKLCLAVTLSHQDIRHSAVLLKAALIQVSDYRLLAVQPSWSEGGTTRHNFGREPSNDYFISLVPIEQLVPDKKIFMFFFQ